MLKNKDIMKESDVTSKDEIVKNAAKENAVMRMDRRTFVKVAGMTAGALALGNLGLIRSSYGQLVAQTQLPGNKIPQFVDPLPLLNVAGGPMETVIAGSGEITLNMLEFKAQVMPSTFVPADTINFDGSTWVFGYRVGPTVAPTTAAGTYIGPVIVATRGQPTQVRYTNNLRANHIHWRDWIDQSLHWANPGSVPMMNPNPPPIGNPARYLGPVPAVPHLHGGEDPPVVDGGPESWFLSDEQISGTWISHGAAYYAGTDVAGAGAHPAATNESIYRYPNSQEAAPLWFHDHVLGATRINATFAGLAGAYAVIDTGLALPAGLHPVGLQNTGGPVRYSVPLVIQDRMFDTNGQLFFPNVGINPEHPYWIPEFVGDTIVVNGKVWPYMNVDQQRYRFYMINGSNSRPYEMFLQDLTSGIKGPRMWVIATDGGYLDAPILIDPNATGAQTKAGIQKTLVMMPGERYEIIVDFADPVWKGLLTAGGVTFPLNLILRNIAPTVNGPPKSSTEGRIMQFRVSVNAPADTSYNPASGVPIRGGTQIIKRLVNTATGALAAGVTANKTRELTLVEIAGPGGPLEVLVNNSKWNGKRADGITPIPGSTQVQNNWLTELLNEGDIEVWEIVNTTMDSHPIHLHGVQFQILNRQAFDTKAFGAAYAAAFPGGVLIPAYGPPLDYFTGNPRALGGNPDITPFLLGLPMPQLSYEAGWKDTAIMHPGEVTRIAVRIAPQDVPVGTAGSFAFDPSVLNGYYVWHCHITDHEDNEMMRPDQFQPKAGAIRTYIQGTDY
ncbi:MAG TPA: multicopper oxidase domain-containing protein [Candidatus Methanoperedens sp.]